MTQAEVAQAVSKGRSTVANALRLLDLPEEAQQLLFEAKDHGGPCSCHSFSAHS